MIRQSLFTSCLFSYDNITPSYLPFQLFYLYSVIQLFLRTGFAWSTNLCSAIQNIPFCSHKISIRFIYPLILDSRITISLTISIALHNDLILLASPLSSLTNDRIRMMTNVPLSGTPAGQGYLLCESGPIYIVSFYLITRDNSLIITGGWV